MSKKTGAIQYCEKKAFGSKWISCYLVIKSNQGSPGELSLFTDKASYFTKKKAIISKSLIKICENHKNSHNGNKSFGFKLTTSKKKKYEFSCNTSSERDEWIRSAMGAMPQMNGNKKTKNGKRTPNTNDSNIDYNNIPDEPFHTLRSKTVRDKYKMDGGDLEFQADLEKYFQGSALAPTEKDKMRKMKVETLKIIIAEWKERQLNEGGDPTSTATHWIDLFHHQTHPESALQAILSFTPAINDNPSKFVREFGEGGGMDHLIKLISFSHGGDKLREAFLRSIRAILNTPNDVGFNIISQHSHIITAIVNMFELKDYRIKVQCLQILSLLCWWKQSSYSAVCKSLQIFATTLGRSTWWPFLINSLDKTRGKWEFRFCLLTLINVLTNSPFIDLEDRVFIRNYHCKHFNILTKFESLEEECQDLELDSVDPNSSDNKNARKIKKQIRVYNITKQQDDHEKIVNDIDLSDPDALFSIIKKDAIEYGYAEQLTHILQNFLLIPNHQRSLRQHVWNNCNKAINICCNPLREQYLADAEKEIVDFYPTPTLVKQLPNISETAKLSETKTTVKFKEATKEESKEESIDNSEDENSVYKDLEDSDSDEELLVIDEDDDEEALYKERLVELPFVLDVGFEDKDGFDFYISDQSSQSGDDKNAKKWNKCKFIFTNLNTKKRLVWELDKSLNILRVVQDDEKAQSITVSLRGRNKNSTLNVVEDSMSMSSTQPINRRQSEKINAQDLDQIDRDIIGDHMTFAVSTSGINFFWEEKRSVTYNVTFNISHSWLIEFKGDGYAKIEQAQFFSCSLLKQFPTFMELNLYLQKLPDFQDTEQELENKLKEKEGELTKYKQIAENRLKKLEIAADTTKKLHTQYVKTRKVAAKMQQDIQLIKQVAPKAFERVAAYYDGVVLQPEQVNVLVEESVTSPISMANSSASALLPAPVPGDKAPIAAPLPGAPIPAPMPGAPIAAPLPGAPIPAPMPGAPMAAPLPGAPMAAPIPGAPMAAPMAGGTMAAPLPGVPMAAPLPGGTMAAPLPGVPMAAPAPFPTGAPIPGGAPIPMAPMGAPIPMAPMGLMGAPIPGGGGGGGAPIPMAPMMGAPMMAMAPPFPGGPPLPGAAPVPFAFPGGLGMPGMPGPPGLASKPAIKKKTPQKPSIKMKTLHWKPINDRKIVGTIWESISKIEDEIVEERSGASFFAPKKNKPKKKKPEKAAEADTDSTAAEEQKDEEKKDEEKKDEEKKDEEKKDEETRTLEELFAAKKTKTKKRKPKPGGAGNKKERKQKKELIEIIADKRSYNVLIGLSRFKMKNSDIKLAVLQMDEEVLNREKLEKLISLAPTPEEVTQMQGYEGPDSDLAACERFFNQFRNMDNIKERLQIWSYKMSFAEDYNDHKSKVDLLSGMSTIIKENQGFKKTLAAILACGNFINGGTKKGGKHGFELETLSKIGAYKTTDSTMSILGYMFKFLRLNYPEALTWIDDMRELPQIVRIETDNLDSEITKMDKDLEKVHDLLKNDSNADKENKENKEEEQDRFGGIMGAFYKDSLVKVQELQKDFSDTIAGVQKLAKFYGEKVKPSQFKLEEFFGIFNEFRLTFIENRDKIIKIEQDKEKEWKKKMAKDRRAKEMRAFKEKKKLDRARKKAEKEQKRKDKAKKKEKRDKRVGFAAVGGDDEGGGGGKRQRRGRKNKTDKMLDEMGDAHKYLAKLRKNRKSKLSKGNLLGTRKKSMFFKTSKQMMLDPNEIATLEKENSTGNLSNY